MRWSNWFLLFWQVFLDNVVEFVRQLQSVSYINLFLTELRWVPFIPSPSLDSLTPSFPLREEDVTQTMYPGLGGRRGTKGGRRREEGGSKVDRVCDAVREALEKLGENK